jgi:hypothetical protein
LPSYRPQTPGHSPVPHHATLVYLPTAIVVYHRQIYFQHQTHARTGERCHGRPEPPIASRLTAKDDPAADLLHHRRQGLAEGEVGCIGTVLAAIADAQSVDFSVMAAQQQSCPEGAEMLSLGNLQITSQAVGGASLLGDVSTGVFCPLVPIQSREVVCRGGYFLLPNRE